MKKLLPLGLALATVLAGTQARAASATWNATTTDGNWVTSGSENNWSTGTATYPGAVTGVTSNQTASFTSSSTTAININSTSLNIGAIAFGASGSALSSFTIGSTSGSSIFLSSGATVTLNNGVTSYGQTETIDAPLVLEGATTISNTSLNTTNVLDIAGAISTGASAGATLTLSGSNVAANTVSGAITDGSGTTTVSKGGNGVWILSGSNNYSGITTEGGGTLVVTNAHGMGSNTTAAAVTISGRGSELSLLNDTTGTVTFGPGSGYNVTQSQSATINVDHNTSNDTEGTIQLGALTENSSLTVTNGDGFNLTFAGGTTISGSPVISNNMTNGTLNLTSVTDTNTSGSKSITFDSVSNTATTLVAGITQTSTDTLSLVQFGPGTTELTAAGAYNGSTTIWGGTLALANTTGAAVSTSSITFDGGTLSDIGSSTTAPAFTSGTGIVAGSNTISTGGSIGHILGLGTITRSTGAVVNFTPLSTSTGTAGSITTSNGLNTMGLLGGWATITTGTSTNFATLTGSTVTAYTNYTTFTSGTGTATVYQLQDASGTTTLTSNTNIGALKITDTGTVDEINTGADSLSISSLANGNGGLLMTGGGSFTITGTGAVGSGNNAAADFIVTVTGGSTLTITNPINVTSGNNGELTKAGTGTLILTASNSAYDSGTYIDGGVLQVSTLANTGTASSVGFTGNILLNGGDLAYTGTTTSTNRAIVLGANGGEIDASGTGPLTITTATITSSNSYPAGLINLTLGGSSTASNTMASSIANGSSATQTGLIKTGAGTWILSGSNGYTGGTAVNAGTLSVTGTISSSTGVAVNGGTLSVSGLVSAPISLAHGATLSGNGGTIGALTLAGGGIINTQDNAIGTLNGSSLTLNAGGGNAVLDLDLGGSFTADLLNLSGVVSMGNNFTVNVNGLTSAGTGTYTIVTAAGGGLVASDFTAGTVGGSLSSGDTMQFVLVGNSIELVLSGTAVSSNNYYFTGTDGSGSFTDPGNYFTAASGGTQQATALSATSNVILTAATASNTPDTLNTTASINSLNFVTGNASLAGSGTLTLAATGTAGLTDSAGIAGDVETVSPAVALGSSQTWVSTANSTLNVTGAISGAQSLALTGNGSYELGGANTFQGLTVGTGSDTPTVYLTNGSNGSATGTTTLRVNAGATLAGNGTSSGTSFNISGTGTATGARATVLVGVTASSGTSTTNVLTLMGSTGTSTLADVNLSFNIDAKSTNSTQLAVGATNISFGTDSVASVKLTLNVENEPAVIASYTTYTLIAGITNTGGTGINGSQYTGLTLGNVLVNSGGVTETQITGNNLQLAFGNSLDQSFYGGNSYLVLYQSAGVDDIDVVVVPEPGTWAMMLGGLALLVVMQRARRRND